MNPYYLTLKVLRKGYLWGHGGVPVHTTAPQVETDPDNVSDTIYHLLRRDTPCMIARFGAFELATVVNYLGVSNPNHSAWKYIKGEQPQWWWNENLLHHMQNNAGFFPLTEDGIERFCQCMIDDMPLVNVLGSWHLKEIYFEDKLRKAQRVRLLGLEPYWSKEPWTRVLEGKHVVVVHPFASDIFSQYTNHREQLFLDKRVLPKFASLRVVKAVQSIGGESNGFTDWFEALEWMQTEMDKQPYDVALIGCGAYGFPLAAHAKRTGHKAVHLGGALQLLFGIRGKRWDNPAYGERYLGEKGKYLTLFNDFWVYPNRNCKPKSAQVVEDGCYW